MFPLLPLWGLRCILQRTSEEQLLTIESAKKFRSKYTHLSNGLIRTGDIVAQLYQNEVLTAKERDDIQQLLPTPIRANEQLLNALLLKDDRAYDYFVTALIGTDQNHIAEIMNREDETLDMKHSVMIQRNYTTLMDNLDLDCGHLLNRLYEARLLIGREIATINAKPTKHEKNEILLALVSKFSAVNFEKFVQILEESSQEHVVWIMTAKHVATTELTASTSTTVQSSVPCKKSKLREKLPKNMRHASRNRKSFLTLDSKFIKCPDELQTEISLKVATLRQKTVLPSEAVVDLCHRKLLQHFVQQKREADRKQTSFGDFREIVRRVTDSAESFANEIGDIHTEREGLRKELDTARRLMDAIGTVSELEQKQEQDRKFWAEEKEDLVNQIQEIQRQCLATVSDLEQKQEQERTSWMDEKEKQELYRQSLVGTLSELEQKREQERKLWAEEKEHLVNEIQELQRQSLDQDRYKSEPVLVHTIGTNSAEERKWIRGLAILDKELFVVSRESSEVEVYDSMPISFSRRWNVKPLTNPWDIGSCNMNKCLYIFDFKRSGDGKKEILRVDQDGKLINKWSTGDDYGFGLSVTDESNVILIVYNKNKLNEYSPEGQLLREIKLSSDDGFSHILHAIKLTNGNFLVSHGTYGVDLHRVCIVDADGKLKKSFGGKSGSGIGQMNCPFYLSVDGNGFVMVADYYNSRVLLLDSDLKFKRETLSKTEKQQLQFPWRILLDEENGLLLVLDYDVDYDKKILRDGRILTFEFK